MSEEKALEHERAAREHWAAREESFERCDTDGFLSQWAAGLNAQREHLLAELEREGNVSEFPALCDLAGRRVRAKLINGKYGACWAMCHKDGRFTRKFVTAFLAKESTMVKKGYREGVEIAPASVKMVGSTMTNVRVVVYRTDKGYPDTAIDDGENANG